MKAATTIGAILTDGDLLYATGLFEADGSAGVYHHPNKLTYQKKDGSSRKITGTTCRVGVKMSDPEAVQFVHFCFGGSYRHPYNKHIGRLMYEWIMTSRGALRVAKLLLPWTKCKRKGDQLQAIVDYYADLDKRRASKYARL